MREQPYWQWEGKRKGERCEDYRIALKSNAGEGGEEEEVEGASGFGGLWEGATEK